MPKPSFILKNPGSVKDTAIILLYSCSDGRLKYYTGESVAPKLFPDNPGKGTKAILSRITDTIGKTVESFKIMGEPLTKDALRSAIDLVLKKKVATAGSSKMFDDMNAVIEKMKTGEILTPSEKKYSPGTIRNFKYTVLLLKQFDPALKISTTSIATYRRFITWCHTKDLSTNYIGTKIKQWKTLGKLTSNNPVFSDPEFKIIQEETADVYLDEKELALIRNAKLPPREDIVRDWFIVGCYTGLRVSDLLLLTKKNISKNLITISNEKTDEKVIIPVHPVVKKILDKWKGLPPVVTDVEINRVIKGVARGAGIKGNFLYTVTKGGKKKDYYLEKWEMISTHTMRRSFITNIRKTEPRNKIVMSLAGIKSERTLSKYDKLSPDEAAKIAAGLPFFK